MMYLTVEYAIKRIAKKVERITGDDITDFLTDSVACYEVDGDGQPALPSYIIQGLETEAAKYIDLIKEYYGGVKDEI